MVGFVLDVEQRAFGAFLLTALQDEDAAFPGTAGNKGGIGIIIAGGAILLETDIGAALS